MFSRRNYNMPIQDRPSSVNEYQYGSPFKTESRNHGHSGKGPKNYRRSDESIQEEACEALYESHSVDASEMEVSVKDGEVFLTGVVEDRYMKRAAEDLIDEIRGVVDVHNRLETKTPRGFLSQLTGNARTYDEGLVQNYTNMN